MSKYIKKPDIQVVNSGSVIQFFLMTKKARAWSNDNLYIESWQWMGEGCFAVDWRIAEGLVPLMQSQGLNVK